MRMIKNLMCEQHSRNTLHAADGLGKCDAPVMSRISTVDTRSSRHIDFAIHMQVLEQLEDEQLLHGVAVMAQETIAFS